MLKNVNNLLGVNSIFYILYSIFFTLFFIKGIIFLDPDFGWHYKFGEIVFSNSSVPTTDTFSYTMPSYPYINHEWLTDVLIFKLYPLVGMIGLSFIFALIATSSLLLVIPRGLTKYSLPIFILSGTILLNFCGVRPQVISWIFLAFIIRCIFEESFYLKTRVFLPLLFLVWVNLHGAFASGFMLITLFVFYRYFTKKPVKKDLIILTLSFIATLINPYFYHIWTEVYKTLFSKYLNEYIAEWQSIISFFNFSILLFISLSTTVIFLMRNKLSKFHIGLYILFLVLGLKSIRHLPVFILIALPLTTQAFYQVFQKAKENHLAKSRAILIYKELIILCLLLLSFEFGYFLVNQKLSESDSYPQKAFEYINKNGAQNNIFTDYGWGGYLIWKLDKKTFIDGRMAIWQDHHYESESENAFKEYLDATTDDELPHSKAEGYPTASSSVKQNKISFSKLADKYHIQTVIWHTPPKTSKKEITWSGKTIKYLQNLLVKKPGKSFIEKVEKAGFKKVYQDDIAVIYER